MPPHVHQPSIARGSRRWRRFAFASAVVVIAASCDSTVAPIVPVATTLTLAPPVGPLTWLGETVQVTVEVEDQVGDAMAGAAISWASFDESVVTVSATGLLTAVSNGSTTVTATSGTASAQAEVTVAQRAVSLTIAPDTALLTALGDTARVTVTLLDFGGSEVVGAVVDWLMLDDGVATVAPSGLLTAVSNGTTLLAATTSGFVETAVVRVAQTPDDVVMGADTVRLDALGATAGLSATVSDRGGAAFPDAPVVWTSSDSSVVSIDSSGVATSAANGSATITATAGTASATTVVAVEQVAASLSMVPDSVVLDDLGATAQLAAIVADPLGAQIAGAAVTWASAEDGVASVDGSGLVTAVATGTVEVSATSGAVSGMVSARVVPELQLAASSPTQQSAEVASSVSLSVRVEDVLGPAYEGATVRWQVASGGGAITTAPESTSDAVGHAGAVWLLGTGAGAQSATASVDTRGSTVSVTFDANATAAPAERAFLLADSALLSGTGETVFLAPSFEDAYGNVALAAPITWQSTDPAVAQVASDGLVTGQAAGTAWVTATLGASVDSVRITLVQRGAITVTYDDGWLTTYTNAWPVMEEFDLPGNVAVYTEAVGWAGYMDETQLGELHDDGWTLVSHTVSHDSLSTLSDPVLDWELRTSRQWLLDRGYERGSGIFIAPFHDFPNRERIAASQYYQAARGTSANIVAPDSLVFWQPSNPYQLTGIDVEQLPYTTVAGRDRLRVMLQRTLDEGRFLDVLFHQVPPADVPALRETLAIIDEFRERVLPYHELYPELARVVR